MDSLFEFCEHLLDVGFIGKTINDFQLGQFDIDGVVILAEKDFDIVAEYQGTALDDEKNITQGDVLNFIT